MQGTGSADGNKYVIRLPLTAVGSPSSKSVLEEVMAFVTASPQAGVVPQNNGTDFLDIAPLQLEGTKTFNARFGAPANKQGPVGSPAITKWFYPNFVVVFENDKVLHAVVVSG